ncbi:Ribonuclease Z [Giardia muris]|uniref:ribonuclease Z n=1 Tax=Giardia muris TaxID=5742 RepID=A0A4Z1T918_GIAMU|nr:Ribonuclease Z [Giardia muris]|eukprot:TNJ30643.1 Ribonuclease Z [Giardia muris]
MDVCILSLCPPSLLVRVRNCRAALLVNAPGGTQRTLGANRLHAESIGHILLTNVLPSSTEGLSGLLQTLAHNKGAIDVAIIHPSELLPLLGLLNSLSTCRYWSNRGISMPAGQAFQETYEPFILRRFLGYTTIFAIVMKDVRTKFDKEKLKEYSLKGTDIKALLAGETVLVNGSEVTFADVGTRRCTIEAILILEEYLVDTRSVEEQLRAILEELNAQSCLLLLPMEYKQVLFAFEVKNVRLQKIWCASLETQKRGSLMGASPLHKDFISLRTCWAKKHPAFLPLANDPSDMLLRKVLLDTFEVLQPPEEMTKERFLEKFGDYDDCNPTTIPCLNPLAPQLFLLGTGASVPSKYRNVAGYALSLPEGNLIIDAGESTLGQLWHCCGEEFDIFIRGLRAILITHSHADHYLGLATIVRRFLVLTSTSSSDARLVVIANPLEQMYLLAASQVDVKEMNRLVLRLPTEGVQDLLLPIKLHVVPAIHLQNLSFSYIISTDDVAIGFSGDTRPTDALATRLKQTSAPLRILVHEATFSELEYEKAIENSHSTIAEALIQGRLSMADFVVLSHFSQRYTKSVPTCTELQNIPPYILGTDLMRLQLTSEYLLSCSTVTKLLYSRIPSDEGLKEG